MMKLNDIAIIIILFIIISITLSILDIIPVNFMNILSYSLITIGMSLVYSESINKNRLLIFLGSLIFLGGVYFLITDNFNIRIIDGMSIPIILIFSGSSLLITHISISTNKIFLLTSVILLSVGLTLFIIHSHWNVTRFINSVVPVINFLWPLAIILIALIFMLKVK